MLTDMHAHIMMPDVEGSKRKILETAERYRVDRFYVSTLGSNIYPNEQEIQECNAATAGFMKEQPNLIKGYVYINPRNANAMDVLRKGMEEQGMSGLKLWVATHCDDPLVYPLVEQMIGYDKPILIHTFVKAVGQTEYESTAYHVANLAERYPEAKLIMAHLGGEPYHGIRSVAKYKNVWIDHSGTLVGSNDLDHAVKLVGADRLLFGTDMPMAFASSYGQVLEADLTAEEREKILWKNTAELFGEGF